MNYLEKIYRHLADSIPGFIKCQFNFHEFCGWQAKSDTRDKFNAAVWFERECVRCPKIERRDFR